MRIAKIVISSSSLSYPGPQGFPEYFDQHTQAQHLQNVDHKLTINTLTFAVGRLS